MILRESFEEKHIRELQAANRRDPILLERVVYAFGLLEALTRVGLPFIFKGGSCLMLLLETPRRLSTDIDIVVEPGTDIDSYIEKAGIIFPFIRQEEEIRQTKRNIEKRHFKFTYNSPVNDSSFYILLDVLFEENPYAATEKKDIQNSLLICDDKPLQAIVPSADCILGDKMTTFAPHTTGIPLGIGKDMEVIKQLYDVCSLINVISDFSIVKSTYESICKTEITYRGIDIVPKDALLDSFNSALTIASRGKIGNTEDYPIYKKGIHDVTDHIFVEKFSAEVASSRAPLIMYLSMCLLTNTPFERITDYTELASKKFVTDDFRVLKSLRKVYPESYAYAIKAEELYLTI